MVETKKCIKCGYPLILKENDNPSDPVFEKAMYEDGNEMCGNCSMNTEKYDPY